MVFYRVFRNTVGNLYYIFMIITDTLSNLFSKIRNGYSSNKSKITHQKSKQIINVLNILLKEGFIRSYKINSNQLDIYLKYRKNKSVIMELIRLSKPGKRLYIKNKDLYKKKRGIYILSTSMGIITDLQAKKLNVGGELICMVF